MKHKRKPIVAGVVSRWLRAAGYAAWNPHMDQDGYLTSHAANGDVHVVFATVADRPTGLPTEGELVMLARYAATLATKGCDATMCVWQNSAALYVRRSEP